ncbi:hypothetical protein F5B17DRAFT_104241 [Nemania serpens]|nr:hypothetical protein F5B17DRAFT_104241 [Nemania serpens]
MAIREPLPESRPRLAQDYRRAPKAPRVSTASLPLREHPPCTVETQSSLPTSREHVSQPFNPHTTSNHRASRSDGFAAYPQSPASARFLSPNGVKEEIVSPAGFPLSFRDAQREALKRKAEEYDGGNDVAFPSSQSFTPYHNSIWHLPASGPRQTRSLTPEPGESSIYSKRPRASLSQDLITATLNQLRTTRNKTPLPPLEVLSAQRTLSKATPEEVNPPVPHEDQYQEPQQQPPREVRRRRTRLLETTHCNIKYHVEELDYIRYHRVDLGMKWALVEAKFRARFPLAVIRKAGGLQGVNYRQNKFLPDINDAGELIFMENGHVKPVCVMTRYQTPQKQRYTLVYLFPDRALAYPWVSQRDQQAARKLNVSRQVQMEQGRRAAQIRGTYVEHLPPDSPPCGCCPGEDRERGGKVRRPGIKNIYKKRRPQYWARSRL